MGFKKGISGNPKGRPKGAKDKIQSSVKEWIQKVIDGNRQQFEDDLEKLEPGERIRTISNLLQYVTPKMQSASPEELLEAEYQKLEELLDTAPDEAVKKIVERVNRLTDERRRETAND